MISHAEVVWFLVATLVVVVVVVVDGTLGCFPPRLTGYPDVCGAMMIRRMKIKMVVVVVVVDYGA